MMLTDDQRWLLAGVGGWEMADCFGWPAQGIDRLMTSMYAASLARRDQRYPEWLEGGFRCGYGRIESCRKVDASNVVVSKRQLASFAATIDDDLVQRLRDTRAAQKKEAVRWCGACFCPDARWHENSSDPLYGDRWHPTDEQYKQHLRFSTRLAATLQAIVVEACGFQQRTGQLDLLVTETLGQPQ